MGPSLFVDIGLLDISTPNSFVTPSYLVVCLYCFFDILSITNELYALVPGNPVGTYMYGSSKLNFPVASIE